MTFSQQATEVLAELDESSPMGAIKRVGKAIKRDHELALELWSTGLRHARFLAALIFDVKLLDEFLIERLAADLDQLDEVDRTRISEWLLANQLMKNKRTSALIDTWQAHSSPTLRRLFWYRQARLRWTGKGDPGNSAALLDAAEQELEGAHPDVQWAMNFCLGWIGIHEPRHRERCVLLGERVGLYRDQVVPRNCAPNYLPAFIEYEVEKLTAAAR